MYHKHPYPNPRCPFGQEYTRAEYRARAEWESVQFDLAMNCGNREIAIGHKRASEAHTLAADSRPARRPKTIAQIRAMSYNARSTYLARLSAEEIERLTEPCDGEAHSNPFIDSCARCLGVRWGRKLKATEV